MSMSYNTVPSHCYNCPLELAAVSKAMATSKVYISLKSFPCEFGSLAPEHCPSMLLCLCSEIISSKITINF